MTICFEPGARPPAHYIPLSIPELAGREWQYVKQCLDSGMVSSVGSFVDRFEREIASYIGVKYAVATVSGTAALHVALLTAGVQPGDEVLVPDLTFIAPANAVRYVGAWPVFMDIEPNYWQLDCHKVAEFLSYGCKWANGEIRNKATGRTVKAILPVHILGHPVNMDPLVTLAREHHLVLIEDAAEGLGATYQGRPVGALGDIACFSFNGNKIITSGGGGMILTNNEAWARKAKYLTTQAKDDPIEYIHDEIGYNYRLTNIQAALACAQLEQLPLHIDRKREIAEVYRKALTHVAGITPMPSAPWACCTNWLYTILVDGDEYGMDSRALLKYLATLHIQSRPLWQPLHRSPAHRASQAYRVEVADQIHQKALSLPCSVGLSYEAQETVLDALTNKEV